MYKLTCIYIYANMDLLIAKCVTCTFSVISVVKIMGAFCFDEVANFAVW